MELKEKIEKNQIDILKATRMGLIILHELEWYYQHILDLKSMEPFSELKNIGNYVEENINNLDLNILMRYLTLCNETGSIVGEGEETEIFSEEEILVIRDQYYTEIQGLKGDSKISNEYAFCIMGALYYIISYFQLLKEKSPKECLLNIISCFFEDMLVDFNDELYSLSKISFIDSTVNLLLDEFID